MTPVSTFSVPPIDQVHELVREGEFFATDVDEQLLVRHATSPPGTGSAVVTCRHAMSLGDDPIRT